MEPVDATQSWYGVHHLPTLEWKGSDPDKRRMDFENPDVNLISTKGQRDR